MALLSESEFKATMGKGMVDVTAEPGEVIDIWTYVASFAAGLPLPSIVLSDQLVEHVYRSDDGGYDHVLLPATGKNTFVVIIVDRAQSRVAGHHVLDLNRAYGLA